MLANSLAVTTVAVTDIVRAKRFYQEQVGLTLPEETPSGFRFGAGKGSQLRPSRVAADTRRVYYERDQEACRRALEALGEVLG